MPRSSPPSTEALEGDPSSELLVRQFHLRVLEGPDQGAEFSSVGDLTVIGTHRSADFVLGDSSVSRLHCEIAFVDGKVVVRDLGSRNGTWVDGVSVVAAHVADQAVLKLGRTAIRFQFGSRHVAIAMSDKRRFGPLVGRSRAMRAVFAVLERAAATDINILVEGETGTGKELVADAVHRDSGRRDGPLIVIDCASIPAGLLESELFGHERGAFTGAQQAHRGAFEQASGGTLFLDEIGELDLELQPKLLRAIESREIRRIGGEKVIPIDVRIVAATNRHLPVEVNAGRFRADLFYRLAVLQVVLPSLRERPEDLPLLIDELLARLGATDHPGAPALKTTRFLAELARHTWPGNVRELRNYLERCLVMNESVPLAGPDVDMGPPPIDPQQPLRTARERWLRYFERRYLEELLRLHGDNVSAAARGAQMDRIHLHRLLSRAGLR